jgi:hypothetical protein
MVMKLPPAAPARDTDAAARDPLVGEAQKYRGNVPLKGFVGWVLLVLLAVAAVGMLVSQLLVAQRQNQLIEETAARVEIQGQGRANTIHEWVEGLNRLGDGIAQAELVRLYLAEVAKNGQNPAASGANISATLPVTGLGSALRAQAPYMQQMVNEFAHKNGFVAVHLLLADGQPVVSYGPVPEAAAQGVVHQVAASGQGQVRPLRAGPNGEVVLDVIRPVGGGDVPVAGVLWFSAPAGKKLAQLVAPSPQDRPGERTALVQVTPGEGGGQPSVVGKSALAALGSSYDDLLESFKSGHALSLSVVDGAATFAALLAVPGTPFQVLQEYKAANALALMDLYKPGLYIIVGLGIVVLAAFMLALTLHLMAQRNKARVKLLGQTMDALVRAVEMRDPNLAGHHARVARLAVQTANKLGLPVGERATLYYAAQMGAVGRILIPRPVLTKGKLKPTERRELEQHIARSFSILEGFEFDLPILPVIQQMYERLDGSGHPAGLEGGQVTRMARVLGTVDAFVALTSPRPHRDAVSPAKALDMLKAPAFDPAVTAALRKVLKS